MESRNQPALVDTSTCICRGPRSKSCIQPSIKPSIHPSKPRHKPSTLVEARRGHSPLIPGLPDDLAIACLIRVPRPHFRTLRQVCKRWHRLLYGNHFYTLRADLHLAEEWIYVMKRDRHGRISCRAFDPCRQRWQPVPPVPHEYSEALGFGSAVLGGHRLYVFGGKQPDKPSMRRVVFYSARTDKWHRAPDMLRRRHFFGSCVVNGRLYVAGGEDDGSGRSLRSAEMYDPVANRWAFVSDMSTSMVPFIGVVYEDRWFLKGLGPLRQVRSEVYDPVTDKWDAVHDGMVAGWRNPCVCLGGALYALECRDGCMLRVYDKESGCWGRRIESGVHLGDSRAFEAASIVVFEGKLCIVRNDSSFSVVDVGAGDWKTVAGKEEVRSLFGSIWSNIAGRNRVKSHIIHCQVLRA